MNNTVEKLVELEWDAFQGVQNVGGRAACQDDGETFAIMRKSQFLAWNEPLRESYLNDLVTAKKKGRNLLAEKYAHMMSYTSPKEYAALKHRLSPVSGEASDLAEKILPVMVDWQKAFALAYPKLAAAGRPVSADSAGAMTSFTIYLHGELLTYSAATLRLLLALVRDMLGKGENMSVTIMKHTVRQYGYSSLEEAEAARPGACAFVQLAASRDGETA